MMNMAQLSMEIPFHFPMAESPSISQRISERRFLRRKVKERDGELCAWCSCKMTTEEATIDHVIPVSFGGPDQPYNLIRACRSCNSARGNTSALDWWHVCIARGLTPHTEGIVQSLQQSLLIGRVGCGYSLYYVVRQLESAAFAPWSSFSFVRTTSPQRSKVA
jgi:hypothetical protein